MTSSDLSRQNTLWFIKESRFPTRSSDFSFWVPPLLFEGRVASFQYGWLGKHSGQRILDLTIYVSFRLLETLVTDLKGYFRLPIFIPVCYHSELKIASQRKKTMYVYAPLANKSLTDPFDVLSNTTYLKTCTQIWPIQVLLSHLFLCPGPSS